MVPETNASRNACDAHPFIRIVQFDNLINIAVLRFDHRPLDTGLAPVSCSFLNQSTPDWNTDTFEISVAIKITKK
jgi:hypothetical protein